MPMAGGFEQCYNAQAAVAAGSLLVVAIDVVLAPNDKQQLEPMLGKIGALPEELGEPETLLADTGYFSAANVEACEKAGIEPLIAMGRQPHHPPLAERFEQAPPAPENPTPVEAMAHRLRTPEGRKVYALRKQTPEPVFGIIKAALGFRQFSLRGLDKVRGEWSLVTMAWNIYVEGLVSVIGHADRASPLRDYCLGLIMPCERKSVEPMAAVTAPDRTAAQHQSLLHFVGQSPWSDEKVLTKAGEMVLPSIESQGPIEAWIIDDTGFPKKGEHSVGVARQYCGQLGKRENCQVAVSLSLANHHASLPVAWRLYLPKEWAANHERRRKAGVPDEIDFKTKPEIALEQIGAALKAGLSRGVVLMDAAYGCNTDLRTGISALALTYVAGILPNTTVWTPGMGPLPPKKWSGCGQRPKRLRRDHEHKPISVEELALGLPKRSWRRIKWREGTAEHLSSRFARLRVRVAHRDYALTESWPEEWLLIEWPESEEKPAKYWLSKPQIATCCGPLIGNSSQRPPADDRIPCRKMLTSAMINFLRMVAIELGTWRSVLGGGASGSITFGNGKFFEPRGVTRS